MIRRLIMNVMAAALMLMAAYGCQNGIKTQNQIPELAVKVLTTEDCIFNETFPATIKGKQDIDIRPQVSGFITEVKIDEGSLVHQGQILFQIDPVQFEEAVNVAEAAVLVAKSNVATAQLTATNKKELAERQVIGEYEMLMADNALASAKALLAQADAQLVSARKNLSYSKVTSPSDGIAGKIPFRVGTLVSPSMPQALTTVSENRVMYAYFSLTEKKLLSMMKSLRSSDLCGSMPPVTLVLADGTTYPLKGTVETISGVIDQSTGSVNVRAAFANPTGVLRSGGTASILVPYDISDAISVPQNATYEIQDKKFAYKVKDDSTVEATEITIFPLNDGKNYVVTAGLKEGDKILTEGIVSVKDGDKIKEK